MVYYRDKNGSKASVVIEAEDRSGVFAELKKRGISAISVSEGTSNKKPRKVASSGAPFKGRGLIAAAIVVLVAGIAAWWMWPEEKKVMEEKNATTVIKKEKGGGILKGDEISEKSVLNEDIVKYENRKRVVEQKEIISNHVQSVIYSTNCVTRPPDPKDPDSKLITAANQEIGSLLSTELGEQPIPFPYSFQIKNGSTGDDSFLRSLKAKVQIREGDSDGKVEMKTKLLDSQIELLQQIKDGISFNESIEEAYRLRVRAYETRKCFIEELSKMAVDEPTLVQDGLRQVNAALQEQGIKKITLEDIGIEEEE